VIEKGIRSKKLFVRIGNTSRQLSLWLNLLYTAKLDFLLRLAQQTPAFASVGITVMEG
jgi:hypothetical protein